MQFRHVLAGTLIAGFLFSVGLISGAPVHSPDEDPGAAPPTASSEGIAVVELFTSESCSSCPPADRLLRSLVEEARASDRPIYGLSFHVDYWNHLGWEDPYSAAAYTERQRSYAEALGDRVYTPQMVVNGTTAFVGSKRSKARSAIQSALSSPPPLEPEVRLVSESAQSPSVRMSLTDPPSNAVVHAALVERGLSQDVTRGENANRMLRHANVVRDFQSTPAPQTQTISLDAPSDLDPSKALVIVYVQDQPSLQILGAARVDLQSAS
jgi:hypothetical protein